MKISMVNCRVCNVETSRRIRCGVLVCEACKRFYLRHRALKDSLKCRDGRWQCLKNDWHQAQMTQSGTVWRHMCAACRFAKCSNIGMGEPARVGSVSCSIIPATRPSDTQLPETRFDYGPFFEMCQRIEQMKQMEENRRRRQQQQQQQQQQEAGGELFNNLIVNYFLNHFLNPTEVTTHQ